MATGNNRIALITGGSRGLGKDMALRLAEDGTDVVITYQSKKEQAEEVVTEIRSLGRKAAAIQLDVARSNSFNDFVNQFGNLLSAEFDRNSFDALVNNAGSGVHASYEETTEEQFDQMVDIHLRAPFFLTQKLLPLLTDGSSIVNISSGLTRFSYEGYEAYGTMKGALETLTRYQAKALGKRKIRVNAVAPGAIETDFGGGAVRDNAQLKSHLSSLTALGRVGLPEDIGGVVAFLCSDSARWVNAQRIEVSGGIYI